MLGVKENIKCFRSATGSLNSRDPNYVVVFCSFDSYFFSDFDDETEEVV